MPRFYRFKIQIDGRTYSGDWTLLMGYRVCVRPLGYVSEIADVGRGTPEEAVARTAAKTIKAQQKRRAAEMKQREQAVARVHRYWEKQKPTTPTKDA